MTPYLHAVSVPLLILAMILHGVGKKTDRPELKKKAKFFGTLGLAAAVAIEIIYAISYHSLRTSARKNGDKGIQQIHPCDVATRAAA